MLICLVYFVVFWTLSSRILFLCCCCVFQVNYGTVSNSSRFIWGHLIVGMDKTSKVLFLHTFHVYQRHVGEDWYILDQVHLEDIAFPLAMLSWVWMETSIVSNDWTCVQDEFPLIYLFSHLLVCSKRHWFISCNIWSCCRNRFGPIHSLLVDVYNHRQGSLARL